MSSDRFDNNIDRVERCFGLKKEYTRRDCITASDWEELRCELQAEYSTYTQGHKIYLCPKCSKRGLIGIAPYMARDKIPFITYGLSDRVPI